MPSVVFLNRFYAPDIAATGQLLADLAEDLVREGWDVSVITGRTAYSGDAPPLPREEVRAGVRVTRVWTTAARRGRVAGYASYLWGAFRALLRAPRGSVVVAMTDPPFLLAPVLAAARVRGFRVAAWVQDVYPQLAVALGVIRPGGALSRGLHALAGRLLKGCDAVVTLAPGMSRVIARMGVDPGRVVHVHNWADAGSVAPVERAENPFVREHGLDGRFVVMYSGTAGRAHTFDAVVEAAGELRDDPELLFLFVGGGAQIPSLRAAAERAGAPVRFLAYQPREMLAASLSAGHVALVTEDPAAAGLVLPSKTYGAMASGRPILYVGPSQQFLREQFEPRIKDLLDQAPTLRGKVARGKKMTKTRKVIAGVP
ncbi:MAG: glycosyltransferase family 4 protein, partial [Gemmatimonadetes bacterium]|nr:glycosyltransferase family 4 protein [Gemmatimonadota bacterium]